MRGVPCVEFPLVVSEQVGSHTEEVVLCWGLVEQAGHEHKSDEYKKRYTIDVPPSPALLVKVRDTTMVPSQLNKGGWSSGRKLASQIRII